MCLTSQVYFKMCRQAEDVRRSVDRQSECPMVRSWNGRREVSEMARSKLVKPLFMPGNIKQESTLYIYTCTKGWYAEDISVDQESTTGSF